MPSTNTQLAIEASNLRKAYGSIVALDDVSLSIPRGTVYGFLGPNGAGKTTMMRLLTGLTQPSAGTVTICGFSIDNRRELTSRVGYLPETPSLHAEFTAREQLEYVADFRDIPPDVADTRISDFLGQFDLVADGNKRISSYSKGMKQKTAFIQSVLHDPDVLFLDEPTSGLDPRAARQLRTSISAFTDAGMTVFLSTHILPVVDSVADEVGVLFDGSVVAEGTPEEVKACASTTGGRSLEDAFLDITSDERQFTGTDSE